MLWGNRVLCNHFMLPKPEAKFVQMLNRQSPCPMNNFQNGLHLTYRIAELKRDVAICFSAKFLVHCNYKNLQ
jgi:hypothetical protein